MKIVTSLLAATAAVTGIVAASPAMAFDLQRASESPTDFHSMLDDNVFNEYVHTEGEALAADTVQRYTLDPTKLSLNYNHDVKVYFINEGANYRNKLGLTATGATKIDDTLFEDIVCLDGDECKYPGYRSSNLDPYYEGGVGIGDYVDVGTVKAGTQLDFWLGQNAYGRENYNVWHGDTSQNSDGLQHLMAYEDEDAPGYLILGWEDLTNGGDKDYNDVIFAVDVGEDNLRELRQSESVPEPSATIALLGTAAFGLAGLRRQRKSDR